MTATPPRTTIFPVTIGGHVHAAWLKDEHPTPEWLTRCGNTIPGANAPTFITVETVTCPGCLEQLDRSARIRAIIGKQTK